MENQEQTEKLPLPEGGTIDFSYAAAQIRAQKLRFGMGDNIPAPVTCPKENWPPDYDQVLAWRQSVLAQLEINPEKVASAKAFYKDHPVEFINHWCNTYDPRNAASGKPTHFPLIMFPRQEELVNFVVACLKGEAPGLVEKSRDMGATWVCIGLSVWLWLFWKGASVGWGSNDQDAVDRLGVPDSIFEKIRMLIRGLPEVFLPEGLQEDKHLFFRRCLNPVNDSVISGEVGDGIGRGGRTLIYFVDEAAHLTHPEKVEASLSETTRVRIDISSVSGLGTVFYRKREAGVEWAPGQPVHRSATNVFIMDWSDHPAKTKEWFLERKAYFRNNGVPHVFAQETERNYAAAVEGVIIEADWVLAALDAHIALGFDDSGGNVAALDVADSGLDRNALARRKGAIVNNLKEWTERDVGVTTRRAVGECIGFQPIELQYDSIGVGAAVKAESNRLKDEGLLPAGVKLVPWNAAAAVLNPHGRVVPKDVNSPLNKDFYANFKAQAWWMARDKFYATWRALNDPDFTWEPEDLVSIDTSKIEPLLLRKLQRELSQPTMSRNPRMKLVVDKAPEGTKSPNLADALVMCLWPWSGPATPMVGLYGPRILQG